MKRGSSVILPLICSGALGFAGFRVSRLAWADHLSRRSDLISRDRAVALEPDVPVFHERLAEVQASTGVQSLSESKVAASLDPASAATFEALGTRAELAGDYPLAEQALQRAASLSRLYQPRYLLAQYYFRQQNADQFWRWYSEALQTAPGDVTPLLELGWRVRPEGQSLAQEAVEARPAISRQILKLLLHHGQLEWAGTVSRRISETASTEDLTVLLAYCNESLERAESRGPLDVWNALCRRGVLPFRAVDPQSPITDSGFAGPPLSAGFGWHAEPAAGLSAVEFRGELRIRFSGDPAESIVAVWQYVPLQAGAAYRLTARMRVADGPAEGLQWRLYYPGQVNWASVTLDPLSDFRAPADVGRLALVYRRPPGISRLAGLAVVSALKMERVP